MQLKEDLKIGTKGELYVRTPLIESLSMSRHSPNKILLKLENCQPCASFKMRGVSKLCQQAVDKGCHMIIGSSGGNAGLATACCARLLSLKCRIFVPKTANQIIVQKIAEEGAEVEVFGQFWNETNEKALKVFEETDNSIFVHPFDDPILWSGHSTIIDELKEQMTGKPSMIISSCGGGGLICGLIEGMRRHHWTDVPIVAIETIGANCFNEAVVKNGGQPVLLPAITSVASSLAPLMICEQLATNYKTGSPPILSHLVEDRDAVDACLRFADEHRMLVEPACGAALAAVYTGLVNTLLAQNCRQYSDGPVVVIVCGGASVTMDYLNEMKFKFNL